MTLGEQNEDCEVTEEVQCQSWGTWGWPPGAGKLVARADSGEELGVSGAARGTDALVRPPHSKGPPFPTYSRASAVPCPPSGSLNTSRTMQRKTVLRVTLAAAPFSQVASWQTTLAQDHAWLPGLWVFLSN